MKKIAVLVICGLLVVTLVWGAQLVIDTVGTYDTPQKMMQAIDDNFDELYGAFASPAAFESFLVSSGALTSDLLGLADADALVTLLSLEAGDIPDISGTYVTIESINTAAELETVANLGAFFNEYADDADAAAVRTTLGLVIGTNVLAPNGSAASLTGLTVSGVAAGTLVIESEGIGSNDNDTTIPTCAAVKDYADSVAAGGGLPTTGGTMTGNITMDDGTGASPDLIFTDGTDETATFEKADSGYLGLTTAAADGLNVLTGNLKVGNGSPGQTIDGEDAYIEGLLEVDGAIHADGGVVGNVTGNVSGSSGSCTGNAATATTATTASTANAGDSATAFFSSGTIESARMATATDTAQGAVELSTTEENQTGTATDKVPTVAGSVEIITQYNTDNGLVVSGLTTVSGISKGDGAGNYSAATPGTDYTIPADWDTWAEHPALTENYFLVGNGSNQPAATTPANSRTALGLGALATTTPGSNVATWLATPSSANLASAVTGVTGSGALVFGTSPSLTTPNIGTPSSGTLTNCTGLPTSGITDGDKGDLSNSSGTWTIDDNAVDYAATSGSFKSLTPVTDDPDNFASNFTGANLYGGTFIANAAGTAVLPAVGAGMNFTIVTLGDVAVVVDPNASDRIIHPSTGTGADGENLTNLSTGGDMIVCQYESASGWLCVSNGWTAE